MNNFAEQSEATGKEIEMLTRAGGRDGMNGLQRFGLLFVRCDLCEFTPSSIFRVPEVPPLKNLLLSVRFIVGSSVG